MADLVKSVLLDAGKTLVNGALSGYSRFAPHHFELGAGFGYTPVSSNVAVNGSLVFTGPAGLIQARALDAQTVRYSMTVPEGAGPFSFGSIILFAAGLDGNPLPFIEMSLPFTIQKVVANPNLSNANPFPKPGDRLVIAVTLTHGFDDGSTTINVTVIAQAFSNLPLYDDESFVPPPSTQPWNQFVLQNHTQTGTPTLVAKRADNTYWAMPMLKNMRHPDFDVISGGVSGDGWQSEQHSFAWGQRYTTDPSLYSGQIGGYSYTEFGIVSPNVVGGSGYTG